MRLCTIGCGYVGLSAAVSFCELNHSVICFDSDTTKINHIKQGQIPIYEPKLKELIQKHIGCAKLNFTTDIKLALDDCDICIIAVGTPSDENGNVDISQVIEASKNIAKNIKKYTVIVNKSTVPMGCAYDIKKTMKNITNVEFDIVSNPEFLRQGSAIDDFLNPQRIIIGTSSQRALDKMYELYIQIKDKIIVMDEKSAELTKYAANSFLAVKISFINEIANLCEKIGGNIEQVKKGLKTDSRIGAQFLEPGLGWGGSCFPKDTSAILNIAKGYNNELKIIKAAIDVNKNQTDVFIDKILKHYDFNVKDKTFALWGLTFKPETNDLREAPSKKIIKKLTQLGAKIKAYDPKGKYDKVAQFNSANEALNGADALIIATQWDEFKNPDFNLIKNKLKDKVIFDGRNIYLDKDLKYYDLKYIYIGKNEQQN